MSLHRRSSSLRSNRRPSRSHTKKIENLYREERVAAILEQNGQRPMLDRSSLAAGESHSGLCMILDIFRAIVVPRIEKLPYQVWKNAAHGVFNSTLYRQGDGLPNNSNHFKALNDCQALVTLYEELIPLLLLDQIAWKMACHVNGPQLTGSPVAVLAWFAEGWKATKKQNYRCNEMEIITRCVASFLYEPGHFVKKKKSSSKKRKRGDDGDDDDHAPEEEQGTNPENGGDEENGDDDVVIVVDNEARDGANVNNEEEEDQFGPDGRAQLQRLRARHARERFELLAEQHRMHPHIGAGSSRQRIIAHREAELADLTRRQAARRRQLMIELRARHERQRQRIEETAVAHREAVRRLDAAAIVARRGGRAAEASRRIDAAAGGEGGGRQEDPQQEVRRMNPRTYRIRRMRAAIERFQDGQPADRNRAILEAELAEMENQLNGDFQDNDDEE